MSMLYELILTPYCNVAYDQDGSDECTIVASNAGHSECESNLVSDKGTATTKFSKIAAGIFIPQRALPWGGKSTNKIAAK